MKRFPNNGNFTYENGYKAWLSAIFIDLRNSTKLFTENSEVDVAKVIRGFTSEVIEILQKDTQDNELKEIGIREIAYLLYIQLLAKKKYMMSTNVQFTLIPI